MMTFDTSDTKDGDIVIDNHGNVAPGDPDSVRKRLAEQVEETVETIDSEDAARLIRTFATWQQLREDKQKESKRLSEKLAARIAQFNEAMNVGHSTTSDQILKLSVVEQRWQELEETRAEKKDVMGAYKDSVKATEQKIKDLIAEAKSAQMKLFGEDEPSD